MLVAVTATAIGFAYDAGSGAKDLSLVFAAAFMIGCIVAVLAVRQSGGQEPSEVSAALGARMQITPTFVLDGRKLTIAPTPEEFRKALDTAVAAAPKK